MIELLGHSTSRAVSAARGLRIGVSDRIQRAATAAAREVSVAVAPPCHRSHSPVTSGVLLRISPGPFVTFEPKHRTVCSNTTISCGAMTSATQDFEISAGRKMVLVLKIPPK